MLILLEQNQRGEELENIRTLCTSAPQHRRADTTHSGKTETQSHAPGAHHPSQAGRAQDKPPEAGNVTGHIMALN